MSAAARLAERPPTLQAAVETVLARDHGEITFLLEEGPVKLRAARLVEEAGRGARLLRERGIEPGDRVAVLGPNRPEWVRWALATWLAGAVLVPIPHPVLIADRSAFGELVGSLVRAAGCRMVIVAPHVAGVVPEGQALPWDSPLPRRTLDRDHEGGPGELAVIQFTSGSTASPKGAALTHAAVVSAIFGLADAVGLLPGEDRLASWLPYFHDYGLFCYLLMPLLTGTDLLTLPTELFAQEPARWFRMLTHGRATMTGGPPSTWAVALRATERSAQPVDLSSTRMAYMAAEPVDPVLVDRLVTSAPQMGLDPQALGAGYGLAEATLTVTRTPSGRGIRIEAVDLSALSRGRAEPATGGTMKRVVSCGPPVGDIQCRIAGADGPLPDRRVGEIEVRGSTIMSGYVGADAPDPFRDGWLRTGDLGYLAEGELYVTGRIKDVIIVLGQNYSPEDIEWAAARVPGVRPGRSVAFPRPGTEDEIVVVVEPRAESEPEGLEGRVRAAVMAAVGLIPREVVVLPRGSIPKTTSGKLQRAAARDAYGRLRSANEAGPGVGS